MHVLRFVPAAKRPGRKLRIRPAICSWIGSSSSSRRARIASEFPGVPHRYCRNHFLRDVAKPVSEIDSHAKVQMRKKVRGLRKIEQAVLKRQGVAAPGDAAGTGTESTSTVTVERADPAAPQADAAGAVVLDYCAAVRGILNDDQGGPLHPPGLRMAEALGEVRQSIDRNVAAKKGGSRSRS